MKNKFLVIVFVLAFFSGFAQQVSVYKINDLLKRIYNKSDTIYIVNFWATWCKPCVAELPAFEKINNEYAASTKTKVLLVSLDFKEDLNKRIKPFLKNNHYKTETIILDETNGNEFINKVTPDWTGAIPATIITQKNKSRFEFFEKKVTYEFLKSKLSE